MLSKDPRQKALAEIHRDIKKLLTSHNPINLKNDLYKKIPPKVISTLDITFEKAFNTIFLKGTDYIEKSFNRQDTILEHQINDMRISSKVSRKNIKSMDKSLSKSNLTNSLFTASSGVAMGFVGVSLPDIFLFTSTLLKGIYETSLNYGFDYKSHSEKIFILRIIRIALMEDNSKFIEYDELYDNMECDLNEEIKKTSTVLSKRIALEKFIQGIPLVGIVGGINNLGVYNRVSKLAKLEYKKRYLMR